MPTLLHGPDVTWGIGWRCPLFVHYWADLQSMHGLHCCGNIKRTLNVSEYMLVLALCLVGYVLIHYVPKKEDTKLMTVTYGTK